MIIIKIKRQVKLNHLLAFWIFLFKPLFTLSILRNITIADFSFRPAASQRLSAGSCEIPPKMLTHLVEPFWCFWILKTNKPTNKSKGLRLVFRGYIFRFFSSFLYFYLFSAQKKIIFSQFRGKKNITNFRGKNYFPNRGIFFQENKHLEYKTLVYLL